MTEIWVTGAGGMLGQAVCARLAALGRPHLRSSSEVDLGDPDALAGFANGRRLSAIINCAAYTAVDDAEGDEAVAERVNATGAGHLAALAAKLGAHLVQVSTDYVFDGRGDHPYPEEAPCAPSSAYGRTKRAGEEAVLATAGEDRRVYVVRTSWLFGEGGGNFVATMLRLMAERDELTVVNDQRGRPTYAPDLAAVLVDLAAGTAPGGVYHYANRGDCTWFDFACAIREGAAKRGAELAVRSIAPVTSDAFPRPAPRPAYSVLATNKLERALGRAPRPWGEALGSYLDRIVGPPA